MLKNIIIGVHLLVSVVLIVVVLMQEAKSDGMSQTMGGSSDTFFGKNNGGTKEAIERKITAGAAVVFVITSVILSMPYFLG